MCYSTRIQCFDDEWKASTLHVDKYFCKVKFWNLIFSTCLLPLTTIDIHKCSNSPRHQTKKTQIFSSYNFTLNLFPYYSIYTSSVFLLLYYSYFFLQTRIVLYLRTYFLHDKLLTIYCINNSCWKCFYFIHILSSSSLLSVLLRCNEYSLL